MRIPEPPPLMPKGFNYAAALDELLKSGRLSEFFETYDRKYYYYDKWKYKAIEWGIAPALLWGAVKTRRRSNYTLEISALPGFTFHLATTSVVQEYLHHFDLNLGGSLQGDTVIPADDKDRYLISSLMEEAIASSQIEGAVTTRRLAKEMLEKNRRPKDKPEQMILNNYEAMKWIVSNKETPITEAAIKQLHTILTRSTLDAAEEVGQYRKDDEIKVIDVQTGKAVYTPPESADIEQLMKDFCAFAQDREKRSFFLHPICKAIILHFLIGYIHPFADGNGRTARAVFYWYLIKKGYWLTEYMSISRVILASKAQYSRAYLYTEQDGNDLTYFVLYNLRAVHRALEELRSYIRRKTAEKQNTITILRNTNLNDRQVVLVQELIQVAAVYFTVKQVETKFGISNQTARTDLNGLVKEGYLEERKAGNRMQYLPVKGFMKKIASKTH